jgi:hypothetical protein
LVKAILKDPGLQSKFIIGSNKTTGALTWSKPALRTWMFHYGEFEGELMTRAEMTGGSPGRATELACMNYQNTKTRSQRNCAIFDKHVAILRMYHKTGALSGVDKLIPHALDAFTADLVIQDLALARPFARIAANICFPEHSAVRCRYKELLFVHNGKEFTTSDLTANMVRFTLPIVGIRLGVNPWRHTTSAWKCKLCNSMEEIMEESEQETIDAAQAGRTRQTDNHHYGISHDALSGVAEDVLPLYLDSSTDWQKQLHVVPGGLQLTYEEASGKNFQDLVKAGCITSSTRHGPKPVLDMNALVCNVVQQLTPALEDLIAKSVGKIGRCLYIYFKAILD